MSVARLFTEADIFELELALLSGGPKRGAGKTTLTTCPLGIPMKKAAFNELLQGVRDAGSRLRGNHKVATRIDRISPDSIAAVRAKLGFSQSQFARAFGISLDTLQNWEQGRRQPTGPAKVLLKVAAKRPEAVLEAVD